MAKSLETYIRNYLQNAEPLEPVPTGMQEQLKPLLGIHTVLFDIYGTLLISASGDISNAAFSIDSAVRSLRECDFIDFSATETAIGTETVTRYFKTIKQIHEAKKEEGIPFPEVDIVQVWEQVIGHLKQLDAIDLRGTPDYRTLAFIFEMYTNPVYPMPGMKETIKALASNATTNLGIVSNSQFYTPIILNYFLGGKVGESQFVHHFNNDLVLYSYQYERAKPDPKLFEMSKEMLKHYNLRPNQTLYVGNDMLNDIHPAAQAGFHTALFAGDERSLRLREDDDAIRGTVPDVVITELTQLKEVLL
jgi:putative hydrolase of the HAD superfamily